MTEFDPAKHCGGKTRAGGKCLRPKGWKTPSPGVGRCAFHGGATPNGQKAAGKEAATAYVHGMLGAEAPGNALDNMTMAVRLTKGSIHFYQAEITKAFVAGDTARMEMLRPQFEAATQRMAMIAKAALDAGVAERQQRLAERQALLLAAAIADGLREVFGELATVERRTAFAKVVGQRLLVLEHEDGDPLVVASTGRRIAA